MRKTRFLFSVMISLVFILKGNAQNFNYSNSISTSVYNDLQNAISLNNGQNWNEQEYTLPLGFSFNLNGHSYDSITICKMGFINFGNENRTTLLAFLGIGYMADSSSSSSLSYLRSGSEGNKVLKLEFKNCGLVEMGDTCRMSYQVWIYETSGNIEIHIGQNDFSTLQDSAIVSQLGLINPLMNTEHNSYLLFGSPDNIQAQSMGEEVGEMKGLIRIPSEGKVVTISKSN